MTKPDEDVSCTERLGDMAAGAVVVMQRSRYDLDQPVKIDRVTNTQIIIGSEKFKRDTGYKIGRTGWDYTRIRVPEVGEIKRLRLAIRQRHIALQLRDVDWTRLPLEALEQIAAVVGGVGMSPNEKVERPRT